MKTKKKIIDQPATRLDVRQIIREELDLAFPDVIKKITKKLGNKIDKMYVLVDKIAGSVQDKRESQELHQDQHRKINDSLKKVEQQLGL